MGFEHCSDVPRVSGLPLPPTGNQVSGSTMLAAGGGELVSLGYLEETENEEPDVPMAFTTS